MTPAAILAGLAVAIGVAGTVLPFLPGLWLIGGAMLFYGLAEGFGFVGVAAMTVAAAGVIGGTYLGIRIPQRSAAGEGLTWRDQLAGLAFGIAGFFVIPVVGLPVGFLVGVFTMRWLRTRNAAAAWASSKRTLAALVKASLAQFSAALVMAASFALWVWVG